jgi:hypothetical protein
MRNFMKTLLLGTVLLAFWSCTHAPDQTKSVLASQVNLSDPASSPESTVSAFLTWYKANGSGLGDDFVLNNGNNEMDSTKFYAVNFPATETYLAKLSATGMISDNYVDKWRMYFKKADQNFKSHPENEGPPEGFDYDFITFSQEDPGLNELEKTKLTVTYKGSNSATVLISFPSAYEYNYLLTKHEQHWQIDEIQSITK